MPAKPPAPLSLPAFIVLLMITLGVACYYRLPSLEERPMHTDEAILAVKTAQFQATGHFEYDKHDFHGPGLHYATWLWSRVAGWGGLESWTDTQVRTVSVVCGLLLLLVTLLVRDALGRTGTVCAMLLMAVSPMQVFYSRYYIMEMLLVLLIAISGASLWRYTQSGKRSWLMLAGLSLGLQHATKETFILNLAAGFVAWLVTSRIVGEFAPRRGGFSLGPSARRPDRPWIWVLVPAVLASVAAFSGGFRDWEAVRDSVLTYQAYWERSAGSGHEKPWYYYLQVLAWFRDGGIRWSEGTILGLALLGIGHGVMGNHSKTPQRQGFVLFSSAYALVLLGGYSLLAYKTPWSILAVQHVLILLAGYGATVVFQAVGGGMLRQVARLGFLAGLYHLSWLSMMAIHHYCADPSNPYVYSHTVKNFPRLTEQVAELERFTGGKPLPLLVVHKDKGWPMRWYWRANPQVEYHEHVPDEPLKAQIVLVAAEEVAAITAKFPPDRPWHNQGFYTVRPNESLVMFVDPALWEHYTAVKMALESGQEAPKPAAPALQPAPATTPAPEATPAPPAPAAPQNTPPAIPPPLASPPSTEAPAPNLESPTIPNPQ